MARPLKFKTPEELQEKIDNYMQEVSNQDRVPTIAGLAVSLDTNRDTLCNYGDREEFSDTIKKAKTLIAAIQEEMALKNRINSSVWIFSAKNNLGYNDKKEVSQTTKLEGEFKINKKAEAIAKKYEEELKESITST
jgi:hypothetical protein